MCGICGFAGFADSKLLKEMTDALEHRGPDDSGKFEDAGISLGHRRLSIIDLSKKGRQPMHNEDESIWVSFNGEIYNFRKLREELEQKGHRFYSDTDTEAIVHAFEEFGSTFVEHLDGMFAFALWDSKNRKLYLVRDRLGKKPLYYAFVDNGIVFASEIKALLKHKEIKAEINLKAVDLFLSMRVVPGKETLFDGVFKLLPGEMISFSEGKTENSFYWEPNENIRERNEGAAAKEFLGLFEKAVEKRLVSDVPIGAFLSGGLDSSSIVAVMSRFNVKPLKTFTVGFGEEMDEFPFAGRIAERFSTEHYKLIVSLKQMTKELPRIIWHLDEPISDPAIMPSYFVTKLARKHVTVALLGEGSDELFAGYSRYQQMNWPYTVLPKRVMEKRYFESDVAFNSSEKKELMSPELKEKTNSGYLPFAKQYINSLPAKETLNKALLFDLRQLLPNYQLMRVDKLSMAFGLEARVPFLDHRIAEFAFSLHPALKLRGSNGKFVIKKAVHEILPKNVTAEKKRIFAIPMKKWFDVELKSIAQQQLEEAVIDRRKLFKREAVSRLFHKQVFGLRKGRYSNQLWMLLMLELWQKIFVDETPFEKISL